jgi:hypothetical protein
MARKPSAAPKRLNPMAIRLDDELLNELRKIAQAETRPVANLVVALIKEALVARKAREKP